MNPVATPFFFYLLSTLAIVFALGCITRKNPVHSAICLIATLVAVAGLYLMLYAPFVAGVQIVVYAGGIMVLFLFVIMLVNLEELEHEERFNKLWHVGVLASVALGALFLTAFARGRHIFPQTFHLFPEAENTQQVGLLLYRNYMLPFEVASVLLLVAIVGAVVMAKKRV